MAAVKHEVFRVSLTFEADISDAITQIQNGTKDIKTSLDTMNSSVQACLTPFSGVFDRLSEIGPVLQAVNNSAKDFNFDVVKIKAAEMALSSFLGALAGIGKEVSPKLKEIGKSASEMFPETSVDNVGYAIERIIDKFREISDLIREEVAALSIGVVEEFNRLSDEITADDGPIRKIYLKFEWLTRATLKESPVPILVDGTIAQMGRIPVAVDEQLNKVHSSLEALRAKVLKLNLGESVTIDLDKVMRELAEGTSSGAKATQDLLQKIAVASEGSSNKVQVNINKIVAEILKLQQTVEKANTSIRLDKIGEWQRSFFDFTGTKAELESMLADVESQFRQLPNRTSADVIRLGTQFKVIKHVFDELITVSEEFTGRAKAGFEMLVQETMKTRGAVSETVKSFALNQIASDTGRDVEQIKSELEPLLQMVAKFGTNIDEVSAKMKQAKIDEDMKRLSDATAEFNRQFKQLSDSGAESFVAEMGRVNDVVGAVRIGLVDQTQILTAVRQAVFGASGATGVFATVLGHAESMLAKLTTKTTPFHREMIRIGEEGVRVAQVMTTQSTTMQRLSATMGLSGKEMTQVTYHLGNLSRAWSGLMTTLSAGGTPSAYQVGAVTQSVTEARTQLDLLKKQFQGKIIPQEVLDSVGALEKALNEESNRVKFLSANLSALKKHTDAKTTSDKNAAEGTSILSRVTNKLTTDVSELVPRYQNLVRELTGFGLKMKESSVAITQTKTAMDYAKGAAGGLFNALALFTGLRFIFDNLAFAVRGVEKSFMDVNNVAQNFEVTVTNMLRGTSVNAQEAFEASMGFIKRQVAETPFELADAVETFQKLTIAGLDPVKWLRPIADAAAAMGKPMEQLAGAFQRLLIKDTGQAIMMLRDFGINVNKAGAWLDKTTGELLSFEEAQAASNMTQEELNNSSAEYAMLELKNGRLMTETGKAMNILNGYLGQTSTYAGAATARSTTFIGVISNLRDVVSNLFMVMGKPVFDKVTKAVSDLLIKIEAIMPALSAMARALGDTMANAIASVLNLLNPLKEQGKEAIAFFRALFSGDLEEAFAIILSLLNQTLDQATIMLNSYLAVALDWGYNFVYQIAEGIVDAASSVLIDALNYVGDIISSFLEPGSPPEEGPLSTIDKWGKELMDVFGASIGRINDLDTINNMTADMAMLFKSAGFVAGDAFIDAFSKLNIGEATAAIQRAQAQAAAAFAGFGNIDMSALMPSMKKGDLSLIDSLVSPLKDFFKSKAFANEEEALEAYRNSREAIAQMVATINETGVLDTEQFDQFRQVLGEQNAELSEYIRLQLKVKEATAKVEAVRQEIIDAEKEGYIPAALKDKLKVAEEEVTATQEAADWQQEILDFNKETVNVQDDFLEGLKESIKGLAKAAKLAGAAAKLGGAAAKGRMAELKTAEQVYKEETALLKLKYDRGAIDQKEYLAGMIRAEERYVDSSYKDGILGGVDESLARIKEMKAVLESLGERGGALVGADEGSVEIPDPSDIFADLIDSEKIRAVGENVGLNIGIGITSKLKEKIPELVSELKRVVLENLKTITAAIKGLFGSEMAQNNFPVFAIITGFFANIIASPILKVLKGIATMLFGAGEASIGGALLKIISPLSRVFVLGALIITAFNNWDKIVEVVNSVKDAVMGFAGVVRDHIISRLGGLDAAKEKFQNVFDGIGKVIESIKSWFKRIPGWIESEDYESIGRSFAFLLRKALGVFVETIWPVAREILIGFAEGLWVTIAGGSDGGGIIAKILEIAGGILKGFFGAIYDMLPAQSRTVVDSIIGVLTSVYNWIVNVFVPGVVSVFNWIVEAVGNIIKAANNIIAFLKAFFGEGRLGGEIVGLFASNFGLLKEVFVTIAQPIKLVWSLIVALAQGFMLLMSKATGTGGILTWLWGIIGIFVKSFFQTIGQMLPFIERALAGIIRAISGVIDVIASIIMGVRLVFQLMVGDWDGAQATFQALTEKLSKGLLKIWTGILLFVVNIYGALITSFVGFIGNFLINAGVFAEQIQYFPSQILASMGEFCNNLVTGLLAAVDSIIKFFVDLTNNIQTYLVTISGNIAAWTDEVGVSVASFLLSLITPVIDFVVDVTEQFVTLRDGVAIWLADVILDIAGKAGDLVASGAEIAQSIWDGLESTWASVEDWFNGAVQNILGPIQEVATGILGIFGGVQDDLVVHSIIPDTTNAVVGLFVGMKAQLDTEISAILVPFTLLCANITIAWGMLLSALVAALTAFTQINFQMILNDILLRANLLLAYVLQEVKTFLENTIAALEEAVAAIKTLIGEIITKFGELIEQVQNTINKINKLNDIDFDDLIDAIDDAIERFKGMEQAAKDAAAAAREANRVGKPPGEPSAAHGAWRIPTTGTWTLHPGETVLPAPIATAWRSLVTNLNSFGIGSRSFNIGIPGTQMVSAANVSGIGGGGGTMINNVFNATINNDMDMRTFENRVVKVLERVIR